MTTRTLRLLCAAAALAAAGPLAAQGATDRATQDAGSATAGDEMAHGEVRKVDKAAGKLTLRHGPLKNLDMPPMTMVFQVKDRALLDKVQAGDKVRFKAADDGGKLTVTEIEPVK
jgi:Cu/Ag efflux protein CusF